MNLSNNRTRLALCVCVASLSACASSQAPKALLDARAAYARAQSGLAHDFSPASLHEAKVALDRAEHRFADDGNTQRTRDAAYIALRKTQLAESSAATEHYQRELQAAKQRQVQAQAKQLDTAQSQLAETREDLHAAEQARQAAEQRAREAFNRLAAAQAAAVKQDDRGTVLTISGNVLFASGKSVLLPGAQERLGQVAEALKANEESNILIEGHTDTTGTREVNMALSKSRAEAVQAFLASRGVSNDRMRAVGVGPDQPVADNGTPEGRANNRRVEIVVQPARSN